MPTRIALIHAVSVAIEPVRQAFAELWPQAECCNVLDDSLSRDRERDGFLTEAMKGRIAALADYAAASGADGILFTCSAFGEAIEAAARRVSIPVLKPNEAMFAMALATGRRFGMLATFAPSIASMEAEFAQMAMSAKGGARLETCCVPGAMAALQTGDGERHDRLVAEAAPRFAECDAVMLAHFSTARAARAVEQAIGRPVLTSPSSAVRKLKAALAEP